MEYGSVNSGNQNDIKSFLKNVPGMDEIDESILKNGIYAKYKDDIVGFIAYEAFLRKGIIRYFVFKNQLEEIYIKNLFINLKNKAQNLGMEVFYTVLNNQDIKDLFVTLGFEELNDKSIYLDEQAFPSLSNDSLILMESKLC